MELQTAVNALVDHGGKNHGSNPQRPTTRTEDSPARRVLVHSCLQQAVKWKIIAENPMENVDKPKLARRQPKVLDRHGLDGALPARVPKHGLFLDRAGGGIDRDAPRRNVSAPLDAPELGQAEPMSQEPGADEKGAPGEKHQIRKAAALLAPGGNHRGAARPPGGQEEDRKLYRGSYANPRLVFARRDGRRLTGSRRGTGAGY